MQGNDTVAAALVRDPSFNPPLTVASPVTEINKLFIIVGSVDQIFVAMAVVVMVSSGIGILLSLYNSMSERRRQIAVLRVLGCPQIRIFGLVITESAVIGAIGAVGGLAISVAGCWLVAGILKDRLGLVVQPAFTLDLNSVKLECCSVTSRASLFTLTFTAPIRVSMMPKRMSMAVILPFMTAISLLMAVISSFMVVTSPFMVVTSPFTAAISPVSAMIRPSTASILRP